MNDEEDAFQEWACKHDKSWKSVKSPNDFECDVCGLQYSSPPPGSFQITIFREPCLQCDRCGLFVHEKCQHVVLSPSLCLFAKTRIRERKSRQTFAQLILPELKLQHALLLQKSKALEGEIKQIGVLLEEASWNLTWALKTFANGFYPEANPEKLTNPSFLPSLLALYGKNPLKFRAFFDKLVETYPSRREFLLEELERFDNELLQKHQVLLGLLEGKEVQLEKLDSDRDELFREIYFPMGSILNSPYRMRFSVQDYIVVAIGDFFLEKIQCKLRLVAGFKEDLGSFVEVEVSGYDSNIASISGSLERFALFGTSLPISTYSAQSMTFSFEFSLKIKCDFAIGRRRWVVNKDDTVVQISNFKHHLLGASFPLPARVLDLVVNSVFASQVKSAVLEMLPVELGDLLQQGKGGASQVEMELRIQSETLVSRKFLSQHFSDMSEPIVPGVEPSHLNQVCIALSPRQTKTEEWNLTKLLGLYNRFFCNKEWRGVWRLYGFPHHQELFQYLIRIDNKPLSLQLEVAQLALQMQVKQVLRCVKDVLLRIYSLDKPAGGGGGGFDMRNGSDKRKKPGSTASSTRAVINEACTSAEQFVHSILFHAVKDLAFGLEFHNHQLLGCEFVVRQFGMTSILFGDFSARYLVLPAANNLIGEWTSGVEVNPTSGAMELQLERGSERQFGLFVSLSELVVKLVCEEAFSFVTIKLGFKPAAVLEAGGGPRVETTLDQLRTCGSFASYFRMMRDLRTRPASGVDEVDLFLERLQHKVGEKLKFGVGLDFQAQSVEEDNDVELKVKVNACKFEDEIELITLFADVQAFVLGGGG